MAYAEDVNSAAHHAPPLDSCPIARTVAAIGDRWTLLILRELLYGVTRFDAIRQDLAIPRTVLSTRLKKLCASGLLTRRAYREKGQRTRHQYALTNKGLDLATVMIAMMNWGERQHPEAPSAARLIERASGATCRVGLMNEAGDPVEIGETRLAFLPSTTSAAKS